jgi:hypothetical protein
MRADVNGWSEVRESAICREFVAEVEVLEPLGVPALQAFPLVHPHDGTVSLELLDDLIESGAAEVTEIDAAGVVPEILVKNRSLQHALVIDGTELRGAKQNRMVNLTLVLAPQSETRIPVSCVEQGRWRYRSSLFTSAKRTVAGKLRRRKAAMVAENLRRSQRASTEQGAVWDEVSACLREAGVQSDTEALDEAFARHDQRLDDVCSRLDRIAANGAIVAVNGVIVGADIFNDADTFSKVWPSLLRGYALDAILESGSDRAVEKKQAMDWLHSLPLRSAAATHAVPGAGQHVAIRGEALVGGVTLLQGRPVHVGIFALEP